MIIWHNIFVVRISLDSFKIFVSTPILSTQIKKQILQIRESIMHMGLPLSIQVLCSSKQTDLSNNSGD